MPCRRYLTDSDDSDDRDEAFESVSYVTWLEGNPLVIPDIVDVMVVNAIAVLDFFMEPGIVEPGAMLIMVDVAGSRFSVNSTLVRSTALHFHAWNSPSATRDAMEEPMRAKAISENFMVN
jgi:hypothetical protein